MIFHRKTDIAPYLPCLYRLSFPGLLWGGFFCLRSTETYHPAQSPRSLWAFNPHPCGAERGSFFLLVIPVASLGLAQTSLAKSPLLFARGYIALLPYMRQHTLGRAISAGRAFGASIASGFFFVSLMGTPGQQCGSGLFSKG